MSVIWAGPASALLAIADKSLTDNGADDQSRGGPENDYDENICRACLEPWCDECPVDWSEINEV
jgi:hypothetical protein